MKVLKNYFYNAIYQTLKVLIPVITIPYLSRVLGPKGIGINSYTFAVIQYFVFLSDLGITMYGTRKISYVRDNRYKLTQTFYEIMIMQMCTVIFAYIAFFIFLKFTNVFYRPYYLAQSLLILSTAFDISWFFMGVENFRITVFRNCIVRLIVLVMIFTFVKSYHDLLLYIILYSLSFVIGNVTLFISLHKYIGLPKFRNLHVLQHFWPSVALFVPNISMQVYLVLNKTMLGYFKGTNDAGFYDQSDKVVKMILSIVTATGTVMLPHVAHAFARGQDRATKDYLCDSFSFVTALSMAMAFGLSAITPSFVPMFFGKSFDIVIPLMMIESSVIVLIAWSNAIGIQYLLPTKQTTQFTVSVIFGSIINIIINIPLILFFGAIGSIIATVISELSVTSYQLFVIRHQVSFKRLFKDVYKYCLSGIVMFIVVIWMNLNLSKTWSMIIIEVLVGIVIYMGLIFIMKTNIFNIIRKMINGNY